MFLDILWLDLDHKDERASKIQGEDSL
jgi:hypothetical protein